MLSRHDFDEGVAVVTSSFNRKIPAQTVDTWYRLIGHAFDGKTWVEACRNTIAEEESFPANFVRAMLSRRPRRSTAEIPINPDTGQPWSLEECNVNIERLQKLMMIVTGDHPAKNAIMACAEASLREGDSVTSRRKWGRFIIERLDQELGRGVVEGAA